MTTAQGPRPVDPLAMAVTHPAPGVIRLRLTGALDFDTAEDLLRTVRHHLRARPAPTAYELDCSGLTACDSTGLSTLLMAHRLTEEAAVPLPLTHRPAFLDRLLDLTGTLNHLTRPADGREMPGVG